MGQNTHVAATLVLAAAFIIPTSVHADSLTGKLWIPGIAFNIDQPAYAPRATYPAYPGFAAIPYSYSKKSCQRAEKYQRRLLKQERKADHRYWKALHNPEKHDRKAERRYERFVYQYP
ncbi:hypothetical protein ACJU26_01145 [Acidithiobacillus sp. M4-SHS-6]|uniref:hypothetical protein n=1 Tax=Acidithiobacillus sp. M4-SHS-6 TaxID=3383024 RepID=UPI0039BE8FB9